MANKDFLLSALNNKNRNATLNPLAGATMPKTGNNAFANFQKQQLVNSVLNKNTASITPKPADNIVAPSNLKTPGQIKQEANKPTTPTTMTFNDEQTKGLNAAYIRQRAGGTNPKDIENLAYASDRGFKPTFDSPTPIAPTPPPIQAPAPTPTPTPAPIVNATSSDAYKAAAQAYIASLAPSSGVTSAKQKYADFVASANLGSENLSGQGRGIPLALVRGQQEKLYNQSQIEAERLQGDIDLGTAEQTAKQAQSLAGMNFEKGLLDLSRGDIKTQNDFQVKLTEAGYTPYTGQIGANVQTFTDPSGKEVKYVAPAATTTKFETAAPGSTIYDPKTGKVVTTLPDKPDTITAYQQAQLDQNEKITPYQQAQLEISKYNAGMPTGKADPVKLQQATRQLDLLDEIEGSADLKSVVGFSSLYSGLVPGTPGYDLRAKITSLKDNLTLGNMGIMKGVLTDRDMAVLASAASALKVGMSEEAFKGELTKIRNQFNQALERSMGTGTEAKADGWF